ncbi:MAG: YitT family protein [Lachnospiraceae bacterium]|nr:YitT family protein [Lachnospiraceae bacterium]
MNRNTRCRIFLDYICIAALAILTAVNYYLFIVKNNFAPAGLSGISMMIQHMTGFSVGYMTLLINIPLCILAYFLISKKFALRTLVYCVIYSLAYLTLQRLDLSPLQYDAHGYDTIYPVILSGVISGIIRGLCTQKDSSMGGTEIVSKYISKIKPRFNFFYVSFALNASVAFISLFVYADTSAADLTYTIIDYKPACLCIVYCFISTFVGNYIISGTQKGYKFTVITSHPDEITQDIFSTLKHGTTRLRAVGSYGKQERTVLICVINCHQLADFKNILEKYDDTFSYSETVNEVYGNFKKIK